MGVQGAHGLRMAWSRCNAAAVTPAGHGCVQEQRPLFLRFRVRVSVAIVLLMKIPSASPFDRIEDPRCGFVFFIRCHLGRVYIRRRVGRACRASL